MFDVLILLTVFRLDFLKNFFIGCLKLLTVYTFHVFVLLTVFKMDFFFSIMIGRLTSLTVICLPFRSVHSLGDGLRGTAQRCHCTGREGCRIDLRATRGKTQPMGQYRGGLVNGWMHVASD